MGKTDLGLPTVPEQNGSRTLCSKEETSSKWTKQSTRSARETSTFTRYIFGISQFGLSEVSTPELKFLTRLEAISDLG